jgi:hypothetical protein
VIPKTIKEDGMTNQKQPFSFCDEYLGFSFNMLLKCIGTVMAIVAGVTIIYVSIFGLSTWTNNMQQAGSLVLAKVRSQPVQAPIKNPPACPTQCPTCGNVALAATA